jgi:hypothetical protein
MSVFCTFGYKCFKVERGKIKKFTFRITQCIYLGPAAGGDRYRLYNEATKHMISSRDVVFRENIFKVSNKHITITTPPYVGLDTVFVDNSTSARSDDIEDDLTNWTLLDEWKFTATSVKKQHNTGSAVSEGEGKSQIPLTTQQQPQTLSLSGDIQFEISSPQSNESESAPSQQDKDEDEDEDDQENDPPGLVDSDDEDEDDVETETLQDNRSIPSTTRISLTNMESGGEGFSSPSLYTDRDVSKSKQKLNSMTEW